MSDTVAPELVSHIKEKRRHVEAFIARAVPRKRRLLNLTIVAGVVAAALTAAPAVGGQPFTAWLTGMLNLTAPSWRLLCGAASLCSVLATVATQLLKSDRLEERVARALSCRAKLEVLEIGIATGQVSASQATSEYLRCAEEAALLDA
jgi:hypothetical protein